MIKKTFKRLGQLVLLAILAAGTYLAFNYRHAAAFPGIISSFYSKAFCSCYFVTEGTPDECHNFARQWIPIQNFGLDKEKRTVTVKGLFVTNTARYTGDRFGCVLEPWR